MHSIFDQPLLGESRSLKMERVAVQQTSSMSIPVDDQGGKRGADTANKMLTPLRELPERLDPYKQIRCVKPLLQDALGTLSD